MALKDDRGPSIWDAFVKIPGEIANNATADVTVDEYHRYKEDVNIMKTMGFDAYRFSFSWSRIFPTGAGKVNWKGVTYYNRLINYMLKIGSSTSTPEKSYAEVELWLREMDVEY
ncbi:beta-glucosidase 1 isoform X3 [Setaria viridis]|uniref:beta-glucosidase 1 isoform X3 n=1 Tax=Setaria viridis TaxID=4556 RepID=UPI003B3AD2EC